MTDHTRELANIVPRDTDLGEGFGAFALAQTAQQAVLPRRLDDNYLYGILNAEGGIELLRTPGYDDIREELRADKPRRIERAVTVADADSLISYLVAHTDSIDADGVDNAAYCHGAGELEVWADLDARTVTAYLDGLDGWRQHSATLRLRHSREWDEWARIDGKLLPQTAFAQFIEDHLSTIGAPDGAQLLDICQSLQAHTNVSFKQSTLLANGQRQFKFEETVEARAGQRGDLTIPAELVLVLRPFTGSESIGITARFRYRLVDGQLTIGVRLAEPERAVEEAFDQIVESVADRLPVPVLNGRP